MHSYLETSNEVLRKHGYRLTPQRHMILNVLLEAREHLTIEHITERVQRLNPTVSLSTVYRTLELFKSLQLVHESHLRDEPPHYEIIDGHAHHHLVCRNCQQTLHLDTTLLGNLDQLLQQQYGFHHLHLNLVATGYCAQCWQNLGTDHSTTHVLPETITSDQPV